MSKQTQDIAKKENTAVAAYVPQKNDFGFDTATTNDIKVPMIYIAQGLSKIVDEGKAQNGDIVENLENQVIAKKGTPARFIPFFFQKSYQVQRMENGKKVFNSNEQWDGEREYETKGKDRDGKETTYFNVPSFNFFVFRENDPNYTRYLLPFRGSRNISKGGKVLLSQLMNKMQGATAQPPFNFLAEINIEQVENDKGKWYIMNAKIARNADGTELATDANTRAKAQSAATDMKELVAAGAQITAHEEIVDEEVEVKNNF